MKSMELLPRTFAMVVNKLTSTKEEPTSIPHHRWEIYTNNSHDRQKQILSNITYCRGLQKGRKEKK